jgi:peptidylprolyl isomerase
MTPFLRRAAIAFAAAFLAIPAVLAADAAKSAAGDKLVIELKTGKVVIKLRPDLAPKHVERVKALAAQGFYDGVKWHRVMEGFMAQTGDPTGTGMGGSKLPDLPAEFSKEPYKRGTVGAARTQNPNSANSQFFICFTDQGCGGLTGQYTVFGQVVEGMDLIDKIKRGAPGSGTVTDPDVMVKVSVQ